MADLDRLIADGPTPGGARLDTLEDAVWARVALRRSKEREARLRLSALAVAALVGGVMGSQIVPPSKPAGGDLAVFSPRVAAAPLDLRSALG